MSEEYSDTGIQDLRAIIHGLRMDGFCEIEDEKAREQITFMIETLPGPEALDSMIESPESLKQVRETIGQIMRLKEMGGKRDEAFKIRYEAKKDMPPRYNILKWRSAMNNRELTKDLIKLSVYADDNKMERFAEKSISLAKKAQTGEDISSEIILLESEWKKEDALTREAQGFFQKMKDKITGGPGKNIVKERQKGEQQVLNSLSYISQIVDSDEFNTTKIMQTLSQMPESTPKQKIEEYIQYIQRIEGEFVDKMDEMSGVAKNYIDTYQKTGNFGVGQTPTQEQQSASEATPENQTKPASNQSVGEKINNPSGTPEQTAEAPQAEAPAARAEPDFNIKGLDSDPNMKQAIVQYLQGSTDDPAIVSPSNQPWLQQVKADPNRRKETMQQLGVTPVWVGAKIKPIDSSKVNWKEGVVQSVNDNAAVTKLDTMNGGTSGISHGNYEVIASSRKWIQVPLRTAQAPSGAKGVNFHRQREQGEEDKKPSMRSMLNKSIPGPNEDALGLNTNQHGYGNQNRSLDQITNQNAYGHVELPPAYKGKTRAELVDIVMKTVDLNSIKNNFKFNVNDYSELTDQQLATILSKKDVAGTVASSKKWVRIA